MAEKDPDFEEAYEIIDKMREVYRDKFNSEGNNLDHALNYCFYAQEGDNYEDIQEHEEENEDFEIIARNLEELIYENDTDGIGSTIDDLGYFVNYQADKSLDKGAYEQFRELYKDLRKSLKTYVLEQDQNHINSQK